MPHPDALAAIESVRAEVERLRTALETQTRVIELAHAIATREGATLGEVLLVLDHGLKFVPDATGRFVERKARQELRSPSGRGG